MRTRNFLGRNKELNRRIKMISGRTGGPKGPNIPAGGLQRPANSRERQAIGPRNLHTFPATIANLVGAARLDRRSKLLQTQVMF